MPKSLWGEQLETDEVSGVICFPLCAREEDPLSPLHGPRSFCLCLSLSLSWCLVSGGMGGGQSQNTPLECMLKNFKKEFNRDHGVKLTPGKFRTFCEIDWPAFGVGWPLEGSLDRLIVSSFWSGCRGSWTPRLVSFYWLLSECSPQLVHMAKAPPRGSM
jgi:hypothetical protein